MPDDITADIYEALRRVVDPCSIATGVPIDIVDMGLVTAVRVDRGKAYVEIAVTSPVCWQVGNIIDAVEKAVAGVPGISSVSCEIDTVTDWLPEMMEAGARRRLRLARPFLNVEK